MCRQTCFHCLQIAYRDPSAIRPGWAGCVEMVLADQRDDHRKLGEGCTPPFQALALQPLNQTSGGSTAEQEQLLQLLSVLVANGGLAQLLSQAPGINGSGGYSTPAQGVVQLPKELGAGEDGQIAAATMALASMAAMQANGHVPPALLRLVSPFRSQLDEVKLLGKGGFGSVAMVRSRLDGRLTAVKRVPFSSKVPPWATPQALEAAHARLLREVRALAVLEGSPHVVRYYNSWIEPDFAKLGPLMQAQQQPLQQHQQQRSMRTHPRHTLQHEAWQHTHKPQPQQRQEQQAPQHDHAEVAQQQGQRQEQTAQNHIQQQQQQQHLQHLQQPLEKLSEQHHQHVQTQQQLLQQQQALLTVTEAVDAPAPFPAGHLPATHDGHGQQVPSSQVCRPQQLLVQLQALAAAVTGRHCNAQHPADGNSDSQQPQERNKSCIITEVTSAPLETAACAVSAPQLAQIRTKAAATGVKAAADAAVAREPVILLPDSSSSDIGCTPSAAADASPHTSTAVAGEPARCYVEVCSSTSSQEHASTHSLKHAFSRIGSSIGQVLSLPLPRTQRTVDSSRTSAQALSTHTANVGEPSDRRADPVISHPSTPTSSAEHIDINSCGEEVPCTDGHSHVPTTASCHIENTTRSNSNSLHGGGNVNDDDCSVSDKPSSIRGSDDHSSSCGSSGGGSCDASMDNSHESSPGSAGDFDGQSLPTVTHNSAFTFGPSTTGAGGQQQTWPTERLDKGRNTAVGTVFGRDRTSDTCSSESMSSSESTSSSDDTDTSEHSHSDHGNIELRNASRAQLAHTTAQVPTGQQIANCSGPAKRTSKAGSSARSSAGLQLALLPGNGAIVRTTANAAAGARWQRPRHKGHLGQPGQAGAPKTWPYTLHISMELVQGLTLDKWMRQQAAQGAAGPPSSQLELELFCQLTLGLCHIHAHGIIHRDLKPANIFLAPVQLPVGTAAGASGSFIVKIGDYGLAVDTNSDISLDSSSSGSLGRSTSSGVNGASNALVSHSRRHTSRVGTASYSAPEQLTGNGEYCTAVDMYSLGLILLELLCRFPTGMERVAAFTAARQGQLPASLLQQHPAEATLVAALLDHDPSARPTAGQVLQHPVIVATLAAAAVAAAERAAASAPAAAQPQQWRPSQAQVSIQSASSGSSSSLADGTGQHAALSTMTQLDAGATRPDVVPLLPALQQQAMAIHTEAGAAATAAAPLPLAPMAAGPEATVYRGEVRSAAELVQLLLDRDAQIAELQARLEAANKQLVALAAVAHG